MANNAHFWAMVGVDETRKFQAYIGSANIDIYLVGYTGTGVYFFDNAYDKSLGVINTWTNIDLSAECPGAIGVIVEIISAGLNQYGLRKNGSTDARYFDGISHVWAIIGCDAAQIIQGFIGNLDVDFFVVGYVTEEAVFKTNADNKSLGATVGAWTDINCAAEAPSSIMLFFEIIVNNGGTYGLRKNGSVEEIYRNSGGHSAGILACDSSHIVEGKISIADGVRFFLVGYATWAGA